MDIVCGRGDSHACVHNRTPRQITIWWMLNLEGRIDVCACVVARSTAGVVDAEELSALTIVCTIAADFPGQLPLKARSMAATQLQTLVTADGVEATGRTLAMELLTRGFATFRPYVDWHAVVRRLMAEMLSVDGAHTEAAAGAVSFATVGAAKAALQRLCAADMGLVSATVCTVLRGAGGVAERWRALQVVGAMVPRFAAQAYGQLEELAGAVVAAIAPKRATERRRLIGAAGAALQGLVRAYPFVSFDTETQGLALGFADGRCVAYDLRTATRTAVLDSRTGRPVAAVAIAPGGGLVASFALGSGELSVWDPAPSALAMVARSLFWADGAAEAQGSVAPSRSMTIPGDFLRHTDDLSLAALLTLARLKWTGERTVQLRIRDATFSLAV
ncbi:hypothetical protein H4S08_000208 [Coemansia sp. RSA 1365]|nr:hypothetical protein H4S08_000208 [Coemansia sp. RSA 1365]